MDLADSEGVADLAEREHMTDLEDLPISGDVNDLVEIRILDGPGGPPRA